MGFGRGWTAALVMIAVPVLGCGDEGAPPSAVPPRPFFDSGVDRDTDAGVPGTDAGSDASAVPGDECGSAIDIRADHDPSEDGAYHIAGNLDDFHDDIAGCGLPNFDADTVYVYVPPADGQIRTRLDDDAYAELAIRASCDDDESELSCVGYAGYGCSDEPCGHLDPVSAGAPVYLIVDGLFTTVREYTLTLQYYPWVREGGACDEADPARTCTPPLLCRTEQDGSRRCRAMVCGDGLVEGDLLHGSGEECDDGNATDGDGCSAGCRVDQQGPGGDDCDGAAPFHLVATHEDLAFGPYGSGASDTTSASPDLSASCATTAASPDEVWLLQIDVATPLTLWATPTTDGYLPVLTLLGDDGAGQCSATELGCAVAEPDRGVGLAFDSLEPGSYWLVVDGIDGDPVSAGSYLLEALAAVL